MQIASVVESLVYEVGIQALTIRDVASRVGCSTTVVSHYFRSKLEMLVFTHREVRRRAENRLLEALDDGKSLTQCLELLLPIDDERWRDWHTWFAFWGMAPAEPTVSSEWHSGTSEANSIFTQIVESAQRNSLVDPSIDAISAATEMQVIVNGIASLVLQDRVAWPADRQRKVLSDLIKVAFSSGETGIPHLANKPPEEGVGQFPAEL
jgi:AcrR family transcriptional regulator